MIEKMKVVLIAEDDPILQRAYRALLGKEHLVQIVSAAKEAIEILRAIKCDAIISNYLLAGSTGEDILDWIRMNQPHNVHRFIFLTGYPIDPNLHPRILVKPATRAELREAIEAVGR